VGFERVAYEQWPYSLHSSESSEVASCHHDPINGLHSCLSCAAACCSCPFHLCVAVSRSSLKDARSECRLRAPAKALPTCACSSRGARSMERDGTIPRGFWQPAPSTPESRPVASTRAERRSYTRILSTTHQPPHTTTLWYLYSSMCYCAYGTMRERAVGINWQLTQACTTHSARESSTR